MIRVTTNSLRPNTTSVVPGTGFVTDKKFG